MYLEFLPMNFQMHQRWKSHTYILIPSNELPNALKEENLSDASIIPSEEHLYALKEGNLIDLLCILGNDDLDNLT